MNVGPVTWSYAGIIKEKKNAPELIKLECERCTYHDWKLKDNKRKNKIHPPPTLCPTYNIWFIGSTVLSRPAAPFYFFYPWAAAGSHWQTDKDKVTGRQTCHLSYLCTPSGNQQQTHWCQTGRSSTGCWMYCLAAGGSLYLNYTIENAVQLISSLHYKLCKAWHKCHILLLKQQ